MCSTNHTVPNWFPVRMMNEQLCIIWSCIYKLEKTVKPINHRRRFLFGKSVGRCSGRDLYLARGQYRRTVPNRIRCTGTICSHLVLTTIECKAVFVQLENGSFGKVDYGYVLIADIFPVDLKDMG